nr:hypothetical protein Itr_chr10CG12620 [Ipomoea trifida]
MEAKSRREIINPGRFNLRSTFEPGRLNFIGVKLAASLVLIDDNNNLGGHLTTMEFVSPEI